MSEQKNVKEAQPVEEQKDMSVAVPATVDDVATKVIKLSAQIQRGGGRVQCG